MKKLVLASSSPRRKELLAHLGIPFEINSPNIEEISNQLNPIEVALDLARQKGRAVIDTMKNDAFVVSSDTIVVFRDKIFGKPKDDNDAREILTTLSGQTHQVTTAVAFHFYFENKLIVHSFAKTTDVEFSEISTQLLNEYIADGEGNDKAGSYGIQGKGLVFIKSVKGSYSNVVGFPLQETIRQLEYVNKEYFKLSYWKNIFDQN